MIHVRNILAAAVTAGLLLPTVQAGGEAGRPSRSHAGTTRWSASAARDVRRQIQLAQRELAKAYAALAKVDTSDAEVKAAQDALNAARREYTALLATARKGLDDNPSVAPHRKVVRELQDRLSGLSDVTLRASVASDLMHARGLMNAAENEVLAVDPDIALAKTAVADAMSAFKAAQASSEAKRQQDPAVLAARQRLADLRHQLSHS